MPVSFRRIVLCSSRDLQISFLRVARVAFAIRARIGAWGTVPEATFTPRANLLARTIILASLVALLAFAAGGLAYIRSPYRTGVEVGIPQPAPFSHQHHVSGLGIDCRYCHSTVEREAFAGMPTTSTCMNCHWAIWNQAEALAPVRQSWQTERPIAWRRVHDLPDFVYFDHSIHVTKGIGCATCHGRVDQMAMLEKSETLYMDWCLECHREPERFIGPRSKAFDMAFDPRSLTDDERQTLADEYDVRNAGLTNCSICHR